MRPHAAGATAPYCTAPYPVVGTAPVPVPAGSSCNDRTVCEIVKTQGAEESRVARSTIGSTS